MSQCIQLHCSAPTPAGHCVVPLLPSRCCVLCVASRRVLLRVTVYQAAQRITNEALALIQDLEDAERGDGIARTIFSEAWSRAEVGAVSQLQVLTCAVLWSEVRVIVVEARGGHCKPLLQCVALCVRMACCFTALATPSTRRGSPSSQTTPCVGGSDGALWSSIGCHHSHSRGGVGMGRHQMCILGVVRRWKCTGVWAGWCEAAVSAARALMLLRKSS